MDLGYKLPKTGFIKVNVHAVFFDHPLPNRNISGIGIVLRDEDGKILLMVSGTKRNLTRIGTELWALLIGLRCAYYLNKHKVELKTKSFDVVREWDEWRWYHDPNNERIIQQLDHRKKDERLMLQVKVIKQSQNALARFLATDGAENRTRLVVFKRPFGRVTQLWHLDMGLGLVDDEFDLIDENEYLQQQQD